MAMPSLIHQVLHFLNIHHLLHVLKEQPIQHFSFAKDLLFSFILHLFHLFFIMVLRRSSLQPR